MKCYTCNKEIKNSYILNKKNYGYTCYRRQLVLILKEKTAIKNDLYNSKCFATIEILKTKSQNSFTKSIISQYNECQKLTMLQLKCIIKSFSEIELSTMYFNMLDIISDNDTKKNLYWSIYNSHELIENFKNDIRFHDLVKRYNKKERIILTFKEDDIIYSVLARKSEIVDYREDEDVKIIEIIEM